MSASPDAIRDTTTGHDPYLWLEDVHGEQALAWVRERNALSEKTLSARPEYTATRRELLKFIHSLSPSGRANSRRASSVL